MVGTLWSFFPPISSAAQLQGFQPKTGIKLFFPDVAKISMEPRLNSFSTNPGQVGLYLFRERTERGAREKEKKNQR